MLTLAFCVLVGAVGVALLPDEVRKGFVDSINNFKNNVKNRAVKLIEGKNDNEPKFS